MNTFNIEVCAFSLQGVLKAQEGKADRIELCGSPFEGGTTPSAALITLAKEKLHIPVMVMIRPRGGDFCYSDQEFEIMKHDVDFCKQVGVAGVVFGILKPDASINKEQTKQLVQRAQGMQTCFHRAIDMAKDYKQAFLDIAKCGVTRVLTSGGKNKAEQGLAAIAQINTLANKMNIQIMVGSGVNSSNAAKIYSQTKVMHYHLSARVWQESAMQWRNPTISMGGMKEVPEYGVLGVDSAQVLALQKTLCQIIK